VVDTRRVMQAIEASGADSELVTSLLSSRSNTEAILAFTLLRGTISERDLHMIVNLRELLSELPAEPFRAGESLEILERGLGYENTGRSYRRAFESSQGVFGVEFLGTAKDCGGIRIHTLQGRSEFRGSASSTIDEAVVPLLVDYGTLLDALLLALEMLGMPLDPIIYVTADDFLIEHGASAARETLDELF
jgi:hypothetical protein